MTELRPVTQTAAAAKALPDAQTVTAVEHFTDRLFSFRVTRPRSLRFRSGEFVMIGLPGDDGRPILRAYSIASPAWDEELEFYSIKVPDGPLTSRLQHIRPGDAIILRPKAVGTLVHDALLPGRRLWLFATGTGFAPFASLLRDPETWERYEQVIITHTCRDVAELTYGRRIVESLPDDPLIGELVAGKLFADLGLPPLSPETDRAMVCGSLAFNIDLKAILEKAGLREGANADPGHFVVEKAFVGDGV
jgi:ferredoxin--NADP+ reductase